MRNQDKLWEEVEHGHEECSVEEGGRDNARKSQEVGMEVWPAEQQYVWTHLWVEVFCAMSSHCQDGTEVSGGDCAKPFGNHGYSSLNSEKIKSLYEAVGSALCTPAIPRRGVCYAWHPGMMASVSDP